jgi:hypothetical protein
MVRHQFAVEGIPAADSFVEGRPAGIPTVGDNWVAFAADILAAEGSLFVADTLAAESSLVVRVANILVGESPGWDTRAAGVLLQVHAGDEEAVAHPGTVHLPTATDWAAVA